MRFQLPEQAFPELQLSVHERQALIDEADRVIEETLAANEAHVARGRRVPTAQWKHVRSREGLQIYRQRHLGASGHKDIAAPVLLHEDALPADVDAAAVVTRGATTTRPWRSGTTASAIMEDSTHHSSSTSSDSPASSSSSSSSPGHPTTAATAAVASAAMTEQWWMEHHKPPHIPAILSIGIIDGTIEDSLYGVLSTDDAGWRWRSAQINDSLEDARVLATIRGPTREDPLRFVGVKWFTKEHPSALTPIVKRRDFLVLEATGMTVDSTGERVGYFLVHSIDVPRIPELSELGILRARTSLCFIIRQANAHSIEVFARGFSDPMGEMLESLSVRLIADAVTAAIRIVDFAYIKKLRWLMLQRQRHEDQERQRRRRRAYDHSLQEQHSTTCVTCRKSTRRLFVSSHSCQVCRELICSKCTVLKDVTVDITVEGTTQRALAFCLRCVMEAKNLPARDVALAEVTQKGFEQLSEGLLTPSNAVASAPLAVVGSPLPTGPPASSSSSSSTTPSSSFSTTKSLRVDTVGTTMLHPRPTTSSSSSNNGDHQGRRQQRRPSVRLTTETPTTGPRIRGEGAILFAA